MATKDKVMALIQNIEACKTLDGLGNLEKIYNSNKKNYPDLTDMMDVMVKDAIQGRREELTPEEPEPEKEEKEDDSDFSSKQVEEVSVSEFVESSWSIIDLESMHVAVIVHENMNPPSKQDASLLKRMDEVSSLTGGHSIVYLNETQDLIRNPLDYDSKSKFVENILPEQAELVRFNKHSSLHTIDDLLSRDFKDVYVVVNEDKVSTFKRAGEYFLKNGGEKFTIVRTNEARKMDSIRMGQLSEDSDFSEFAELVPDAIDSVELWEALEGIWSSSEKV